MSENDFSDIMAKHQKEFTSSFPDKLANMKTLVDQLHQDPNSSTFADLRMLVHKMAGNAGTFGFQAVSDLCKKWDAKLTPLVENFSPEGVLSIMSELDSLASELEQLFKEKL